MTAIPGPPPFTGQPFVIKLLLDIDDHGAQAAALRIDDGVGDDDPDWRFMLSGADNPARARNSMLEAALKKGMSDLFPEAKLSVLEVGPPDPDTAV